jgi:hypothetical protein
MSSKQDHLVEDSTAMKVLSSITLLAAVLVAQPATAKEVNLLVEHRRSSAGKGRIP